MNHINRRNWLRTAGLSSGLIFLGGIDAIASEITTRESKETANTISLSWIMKS